MVYTIMYLMFCRSNLNMFLVCLIHFIFTVGNYILKANNNYVSSVTVAIFSTVVKHDSFIYHIVMLIILLYTQKNN